MTRKKKVRPKRLKSLGKFGERFDCSKDTSLLSPSESQLLCCREECTGDYHCQHCERYPARLDP